MAAFAVQILQTVRRAIGADTRARLLIHEIVMSDSNPTLIKATVDLQVGRLARKLLCWRACAALNAPPTAGPCLLSVPLLDMRLQMMSMVGGKERTEGEWRALLEAGGFELERVVRLRSLHDLVVARAKA